jgi:hypothetical protein
VSTKIIKINRGDSFEFTTTIPRKDDPTKNYMLTSRDALYFAILNPHQNFENAIILKGWRGGIQDPDIDESTGEIKIRLTSKETRSLNPGVYYYSTKLQRGGSLEDFGYYEEPDEVRTIIERTKFIVNE